MAPKYREIFESRQKVLQNLIESRTFSLKDICRLLEVDLTRVRHAAVKAGLSLEDLPKESILPIEPFLEKRDIGFERLQRRDGERAALICYALARPPKARQEADRVMELLSFEQASKDLTHAGVPEILVQKAYEARSLSSALKFTNQAPGTEELFYKGKAFRTAKENRDALELVVIGENSKEILRSCQISVSNLKLLQKFCVGLQATCALSKEEMVNALLEGETIKDIFHCAVSKERDLASAMEEAKKIGNREGKGALDFRRRVKEQQYEDLIFEDYVHHKMTQQEIADKYHLLRTDVVKSLKWTRAQRQDEVMRTNMPLWRNRNTAEKGRLAKKAREEAVKACYAPEKSVEQISREAGCSISLVQEYLERNAMQTLSQKQKTERRQGFRKLLEQGKSPEEAAEALNIPEGSISYYLSEVERVKQDGQWREDMMRRSYKGSQSTSQIMERYGYDRKDANARYKVLSRQKKSSRYILGNPELIEPVIAEKGDVPGIFSSDGQFLERIRSEQEHLPSPEKEF